MSVDFKAAFPDQIKMSMNIVMTLDEWKRLREQLGVNPDYPAWSFQASITDLVRQAEKHFYPDKE
jgi:hypothetical protein